MNTRDTMKRYFTEAIDAVRRIEDVNADAILAAARDAAERITRGGKLKVFGCGHSALVCQDVYYRAGGLEDVMWLSEPRIRLDHVPVHETSGHEKTEGWITEALKDGPEPDDVVIVVSTSGVNAAPLDVARAARERGSLVIGVRSAAYDGAVAARHSSGQRLADVAHHVLDNLSPIGDTLVPVAGGAYMGSASTATGALLLQALMVAIHEETAAVGIEMPVWISANVPRPDSTS